MSEKDFTVMSKKEQVSHIFKELEDALHKAIDQGLTDEYHVLELVALSVSTYVEKCRVFALAQKYGYNPTDPTEQQKKLTLVEKDDSNLDNIVSLDDVKKGDLH